jgi:hypothetical protein
MEESCFLGVCEVGLEVAFVWDDGMGWCARDGLCDSVDAERLTRRTYSTSIMK